MIKVLKKNPIEESLKPITLTKKRINKVDNFGIIEVPVPPITYIYTDKNDAQE